MMQKPKCYGTGEHSNTSLICRRCYYEKKCYKALELVKKGRKEYDRICQRNKKSTNEATE